MQYAPWPRGRCCVAPTCRALERDFDLCSDRQGQLVERHGQPSGHRLLGGQLVVSAAKVLDEGMPDEHHPGVTVLLEAAHRSQPGLQPTVICLDPIVGVLVGTMRMAAVPLSL
jgi:hypothetical protein